MERAIAYVLLFVIGTIVTSEAQETTYVSYMTPKYGGENGATQIKIFGQGFAVQMTFAGEEPRKEVFLVNSVNQYVCDIHEAESDETQTVCYTREMTKGTYYIRMKLNGVWLDNSHYCNNAYTSWNCRFHVNSGRTPLVESLNATTLEPESLIKIRGRLFTNLISSAVATATNGQTSNIARIWLTSGQCDHLKDTDVPYGISLEGAEGESNWGSLTCKIRSKYVGNQNFSFIVNEGFGRSRPYSSTKHLSADNRIYMLQTYAVVTDVSPKEGSTVGGTMLTISGRNFDDQSGIRARVMVGGVACTVTSVTDNQIICKTATEPATSKSVYAGGRGLNIEVFPGITDKDATLDTSVSGYLTFHTDKSESGTISGENFVSRSRGFYYPAVTGGHIFNLAADDNADLYINSNGEDEAGKTKIITSGGNSASVTLQARTPHYFEIRHLQGTGGANFKLKVKVDTTNYTPENTALAVSEVQTVAITSTLNHEHQSISLEDWVEQTPVSSQWTIETTCSISSCSGHSFTITVFKTSTDPILFGATEFEVKSAITALIPTNSEVETVTYVNDTYDITFKTNRGKIELSATSNSGDLSVTTTEVQVGVPKLDTFTLTVDGYISTPIAFDAPTSHVVNAINSLFGPRCPHQLGTTLAGNSFKYFDFETNTGVYSGAISSENSFCGTRSLKNPSYLFNEWDNSYFTAVYSKVCFAYIGDINSHLWISYFFEDVDNNNALVEYYLVAFNGLGLEDSTTWKHVCVDVEKLLKEKHANGNNFKIRQLYIAAGNDPDTDHYVDNFFIASSVSLSDDQIQEMQRRIQPSAVPSIKLESLTVTKTNNVYNITFYPIDCGSSFPLLGVAFTSQTTVSSDEAVYGIDWNSTSRVRVTRLMAASPAVTGTFDISFADPTFGSLSALPTNISADDLTLQLQSLAGVNTVNVVKSGTCYGYSWQTTFVSPGGKYPAMTTDGTNMVGNSPVVTPTVVTEGGINMNPIYGDFFSTGHSQPQVQVYINNVPSKCDGDYDSDAATSCGFQWSSAATPTLTNVTPTSGVTGDLISLTGSGFGTTASDVTVTIGGVACTVSTVTDTSVSCTLGESPGGTQTIAVKVAGKGSAASTAGTFTVTSAVTSITPTSGSTNGCTTVTIAGSAFDTLSSTVAIGGYDCVVSMVTYSTIVCTTSAATSAGSVSVVVTTSSVAATSSVTYEYTDTGAASISAISSTTYTSNGGTRVTITGTNFGTTQGVVTFGTNSVTVASWSDTSIEIDTPALAPATYDLRVIIQPNGCALNSVAASVTYGFSVSSISETTGSHMGGTTITIAGEGFTTGTSVTFGDITCDATVTSSTEMTCVTSSSGVVHNVTNDGAHATYGIGYAWNPSNLEVEVGDVVRFLWSVPEMVEGKKIGVYTTADAVSKSFNEDGFNVPSSVSGSHVHTFTVAGDYFYASGCLDDACSIFMRGKIVVKPVTAKTRTLSVKLGGHEAEYPVSGAPSFSFDGAPTVTSISPQTGTTDTTITITGTQFTNVAPSVKIQGMTCTVLTSSATQITCKVPTSEEMPVATYGEVVVNVASVGNALVEIKNLTNRYFALLPLVSSISPTSGSTAGGTKLTIQGSGFTTSSTVMIGTATTCTVIADETSYTQLVCTTPAVGSAVSGAVKITQSGQEATCSLCTFAFDDASTPSITSRSETTTDRSSVPMVISGSGFGSTLGDVTVTVGMVSCVLSSVTDTEINCDVGRFAAGGNDIVVHIAGKGNAKFSNNADSSISNPALVDSLTPSIGSINGGTKLTIAGNGFVSSDVSVKIDGTDCPITSSDFGTIVCTPAAHSAATVSVIVTSQGTDFPSKDFEYSATATPSVDVANPTEGMSGNTLTLTGTGFGTSANDVAVTVGGVACAVTSVIDTQVECTLGSREGGSAPIAVNVGAAGDATVSATFSYILSVSAVAPIEGSYGGGQSITVTGQGFSNNTVVTVCGNACIVSSDTTTQVVCATPSNANTDATTACDVKIANGVDSVTHTTQYEYKTSLTPEVTSVSPSSGGTAGGTRITITGSGFTLNSATPTVKIDGSVCDIETSTDTSIICVTNAHTGSKKAKVAVTVGTNGIATQGAADFYYIDKWSSIFTWGGTTVPTTSDFVIINEGQTILLDTDTAVLKMLLIQGGELIFDEKDVTLKAENILITKQGKLQVGTEEAPFQHKAIIEMHGHLRSPELPIYGAKTLAVRNGTLDLHGKFIPQTWSKLASTAAAGATQITLEHSVTWQVNDEIVIATTGLRHSQSQTEKKTISAVSADGRTLTLTDALKYEHLGVSETFGSHTIHFRAEVGLLTRNIVFRGSDDHVWHDDIPACPDGFDTGEFAQQTCFQGRFGDETGSDQFGASIMMHAADESKGTALARIEGIEATYVGQAFRLGRYPIHFHLMGQVGGMYVRRCSIHKTFNRAVTIHGTHNLTVEHNVVYDVMGGAIFIEDGIETNNVIQYNLAIFVKQSTSLLNDDVTPAAYWVTNPDNIIRHNHAAGGTHFGAWYRMHTHPDGPSFTSTVCQKNVELGQFENNTVHSQGWFGLWIFQDYFPKQGGSCGSNEPSPAHFRSLTTWNCEKGAEWVNGGALQFIDFFMVNNEVSGMDLKTISGTKWGADKGAMIKDAVIVGHSSVVSSSFQTGTGIVMPFSSKLFIDGAEFYNFNRGGVPFGVTSIDGTCSTLCGGFYYWTQRLSFTNANRKFRFRWEHEAAVLDRDGTLNGRAGTTLVSESALLDPAVCKVQEGPVYSSGAAKGVICDEGVDFHRFALKDPVPTSLEGKDLILTNQHGNSTSRFLKKRITHKPGHMLLLPDGKTYTMGFKDGGQFTNITYQSTYYSFGPQHYIYVTQELKQTPDVIAVNGVKTGINGSSAPTDESPHGSAYFDPNTRGFTVKIAGAASSRKKRAITEEEANAQVTRSISPNIYRCYYEGCAPPVDPANVPPSRERPDITQTWSQNTSCTKWTDDKNVVIPSSVEIDGVETECWVLFDVPTLDVESITVQGVVDFTQSSTLTVEKLLILGGRVVAGFSPTEPFIHNLVINLRGTHSSPGIIYPGISVGSKVIGCFGGLDLHGKKHNVLKSDLASTANVGAQSITLRDAVDWVVGEEIVITTTGYRSIETEKKTITSVSGDMKTIGLNSALEYRHMGETYSVNGFRLDMRAEVALLTHNIKIVGESYDTIDKEAFGGRVLVGSTSSSSGDPLTGWARISNVEFLRAGQEGWTESYDPRFGVAFVRTGTVSAGRPSYVQNSAFHDSYSTAIGIFGASGINITGNVVHRAIHDGIRVTGSNHRVVGNLVTVTLFRGAYGDRFEKDNYLDWQAAFQLSEATDVVVVNNTAAGSERIGFHVDGEACDAGDENAWMGNVAHGCLHGIQIFIPDGIFPCSMLRNFVVYKSWDYAIYHQTQTSVIIKDTIIADSTVGLLPVLFAPPALSHTYINKFSKLDNVLCIARTDHFDPTQDFMDERTDKNLIVRDFGKVRSAPRNPHGGKTCLLLPLFQSGTTGSPFKPFNNNKNYPMLHGVFNITKFTANNVKLQADGTRDLVMWTNPSNEDAVHPTILSQTSLINVEEASKVFIDRPSLGKINPADCVDMECDAKKKVLIKDMDGGFLTAPGSIIPQAEFGWDDDSEISRGLGDYRIPKAMLTGTEGTRIPVTSIADQRGIIRNSACTYKSIWQAYDCHGDGVLDYQMLVIESLDDDTETRRLSPVALNGGRTIDLNNGPQDHGWCSGYTCQKRISTFYVIVTSGTHFDVFFTGYAPRNLKLHLLNVENDKTVRVAIWYPRPERLDVYQAEKDLYIFPQNSFYDTTRDLWNTKQPDTNTPDQYKPAIDSGVNGANYIDLKTRLLYVTIRGSEPVKIVTVPMIQIAIGFPAISVDDFFGDNLVQNLATYLGVPSYKIRVVNVVRETSRRRRDLRSRRSTDVVTYTIEYGDEIVNGTGSNATSNSSLAAEFLNQGVTQMLADYQTGKLWQILNVTEGTSFSSTQAATNLTTSEDYETYLIEHKIPTSMSIASLPSTAEEYLVFPTQPVVTLLDSEGLPVTTLGSIWSVSVALDTTNGDNRATLMGTTTATFNQNGTAIFTNLMITHSGSGYVLRFTISQPTGVNVQANPTIEITQRTVNVAFTSGVGSLINHNDDALMTMQLQNSAGDNLPMVGYKGHTWKATVAFDDPTLYKGAKISGITTFTFDPSTGSVSTAGLKILSTLSYHKYNLLFTVTTEPALYNIFAQAEPIQFKSPTDVLHLSTTVIRKASLELEGQSFLQRAKTTVPQVTTFTTFMHNSMVTQLPTVMISGLTATVNSDGNTVVEFTINAYNDSIADEAVVTLRGNAGNLGLTFNGQQLTVVNPACAVKIDDICSTQTNNIMVDPTGVEAWIIIVACVVVAVVLAVGFIGFSCYMKRAHRGKVASGACMSSSHSSLGSSAFITGSSENSTPVPPVTPVNI